VTQRAAVNHNLGEVYLRLGKYDRAAIFLQRAARFWEETGEKSAAAASLLQLGNVLRRQGRYRGAAGMLQRAREICGAYCANGLQAAVGLALQGDLDLAQGRLAEAESAFLRAGDEAMKHAGAGVQADIQSSLAMVYRRQARYREAEHAARRAIDLARESGDDRSRIAASTANLGLIQAFEGKYRAARKSLQTALEMTETAAGADSAEAAAILSNLAFVDQQTGRLESAQSLLRRALEIDRNIYGREHPAVASVLAGLGVVAIQQGDPGAAEESLRQALALNEKLLGGDHPETATVLVHLGLALTASGQAETALELFERAASIRTRVLGPEHPEVAVALAHWAKALRAAGRKPEAAQLEKRARDVSSTHARSSFTGETVDIETLLQQPFPEP
jgi:tetratricopeptide (TPR) repeat protein